MQEQDGVARKKGWDSKVNEGVPGRTKVCQGVPGRQLVGVQPGKATVGGHGTRMCQVCQGDRWESCNPVQPLWPNPLQATIGEACMRPWVGRWVTCSKLHAVCSSMGFMLTYSL